MNPRSIASTTGRSGPCALENRSGHGTNGPIAPAAFPDHNSGTMIEIVYRYDPRRPAAARQPATPAEAVDRLVEGNRRLSALVQEDEQGGGGETRAVHFDLDLGAGTSPGDGPEQSPFGVILGCADARVPVEMVFGQAVNDLFVVRVAGNVIGSECLGSIDYAVHHFTNVVKVIAVLGHSSCGAVSAAVDAFLRPGVYLELAGSYPLRSIVDRILVAVRAASRGLEDAHGRDATDHPGYRRALVEASVAVNAAYASYSLREELPPERRDHVRVVYGIHDLATRRVQPGAGDAVGLAEPPAGLGEFRELVAAVAVRALSSEP
jgi:carbonic anhydrase